MQSGYCYFRSEQEQMHYLYFWDEEVQRYFMRMKYNALFNTEDDYDDLYLKDLPDKGHWSC